MTAQQQIPEYKQGDTVLLTVELRDEHGVTYAGTSALIEGETRGDAPLDRSLELAGWPEEPTTHAEIELTGTVEQQQPGLYTCYAIVAENTYKALSRYELNPPLRLRIVEHPDDVREGPEVLSVGSLR